MPQPLPPGFVLETPGRQRQGAPLPPGFVLERPVASEQPATAADLVASTQQEFGVAPQPEQPQQPQQGNPISRFIGNFADEKVLPGAPGAIGQGVAGAVEGIAERPVQTLVVDPLTAPTRIVPPMKEIVPNLMQGKFGEAGKNVAESATALGETALLAGGPLTSAGGRAAGAAAKPVARSAGEQLVDDAARVGVDVTAPVAFPKTAGAAAKPLSENLAAGVTTRAGADRTLKQLEDAVTRQADEFSPGATIDDAGAAAREGTKRFNARSQVTPDEAATITQPSRSSTFRDKAEALYNKAYRGFDAQAKAPAASTAERLQDVNSRFSNAALQEIFALPVARKLDEALQGGQISVADMRALRTEIREIQNTGKFLKTKDDAALERLESALTDDIYAAVKASGGDQALSRLKRADRFYRLGAERMRKALEPFLRDKATDETAVQSILRASKGQGKGDIQRLRALRRSLRPEEMDDISAGILREMGRAKEGADFSPEVFARAWATMGDEAKATLFSRAQRPAVRQNIDALARVIERQSTVEKFSNRSQSGASLQNIATGGAMLAEPVTATAALLGANAFGRAMMSPTFTKLLLQLNRNTARATRAGANVAAEEARILAMIAAAEQSDTAIRPYTQELRAAISGSNDNFAQSANRKASQ